VKFDFPVSIPLAVAVPSLEGVARGSVKLKYDVTNAVVTGSRRLLKSFDVDNTRIQCEAINVEGRLESYTTRLRLIPPGNAVNVTIEPPDMVVDVFISSKNATTKIEHVPLSVSQPTGAANRWFTEPQFVDVEVNGRSELLKSVKFSDIMVSVDGNIPLVPGLTNEVPVIVHVRQGLEIDSVKSLPETVNLIPIVDLNPAEPITNKKP
jgi:hypothetical protein